jgi:hypothetical protein
MAKTIYWGVDSATPANFRLGWKGKKPYTLFDHVVDQWKRMPAFWGRYLNDYAVTADEIDYIFQRSEGACRVLLIYNGVTADSMLAGFMGGYLDATDALLGASALNAPRGVILWGDIEGRFSLATAKSPEAKEVVEWTRGWCATMQAAGHPSGFYGRTTLKEFTQPFVDALLSDPDVHSLPYLLDPSARNPRDQKAIAIPPHPPGKLRLLWTTQPQMGRWTHPSTDRFEFTPTEAAGAPGRVALWQYYDQPGDGYVDFDLADDRAYDLMWEGVVMRILDPFRAG